MTDTRAPDPAPDRTGPAVVAIGGGHGLAMTLRAVREYAGSITAIVSVADDGGSTGRLRRDLGVLGVGDLRKCLVALAADTADPDSGPDGARDETVWARVFEHRFAAGELEGHALGNLMLVGLAEITGDWEHALATAGRTLGAVGRVIPATAESVVIKADVEGGKIEGQVAVQNSVAPIRRVAIVPPDAPSPAAATAAILSADQIVLAPGSLYTSLLPALIARDVTAALAQTSAPIVGIANLAPQIPETQGLDVADHLRAVLDAGIRVDQLVVDRRSPLLLDVDVIEALGVGVTTADVARPDVTAHVPAKLAPVLVALLES